jgi:hypothetical protein
MKKLSILSEAKFRPEYGEHVQHLEGLRGSLQSLAPEDADLLEDYEHTRWRKRTAYRQQLTMESQVAGGELPPGGEPLLRHSVKLDQLNHAQRKEIQLIRQRQDAGEYSPAVPAKAATTANQISNRKAPARARERSARRRVEPERS